MRVWVLSAFPKFCGSVCIIDKVSVEFACWKCRFEKSVDSYSIFSKTIKKPILVDMINGLNYLFWICLYFLTFLRWSWGIGYLCQLGEGKCVARWVIKCRNPTAKNVEKIIFLNNKLFLQFKSKFKNVFGCNTFGINF